MIGISDLIRILNDATGQEPTLVKAAESTLTQSVDNPEIILLLTQVYAKDDLPINVRLGKRTRY